MMKYEEPKMEVIELEKKDIKTQLSEAGSTNGNVANFPLRQ